MEYFEIIRNWKKEQIEILLKKKEISIEDYEEELSNIKSKYDNKNYSKLRKFKEIYFLYGMYIFFNNSKESEKESFFKDGDNKVKWCSFKNGPIIKEINNEKIYLPKGIDGEIIINFNKWSKNNKEVFRLSFDILESQRITQLVKESHATKPWKDNNFKEKEWKEIPYKDIVKWFKKNEPFFMK